MNIKVLDGLAASEHTGEFTGEKSKNDKFGALISQRMSRLETHTAPATAKGNLLSLTAAKPIQLKSQTLH